MLRLVRLAGLALLIASCETTGPRHFRDEAERFRDDTEDGVSLFQHGDFTHARECFEAALNLRPGDPDVLYNLGRCHEQLGNTSRAEQIYVDCLRRAPNHPECRHALTALLVREDRRAEAVAMVQDWLAREPRLAAPYAEDAWLWRQAGDPIKAQGRLQQALDLDPRDSRTLTEMAQIYEERQQPERALALYERALDSNPRRTDVAQCISRLRAQGVGKPKLD
jgi:Tfp pilus assembly protein PilF